MKKDKPRFSTYNLKPNNVQTLFLVGPTASGKSSLAMKLASKMNGEIVCADSQTVKKYMDIGTAKPSVSDRAEIPHHMIDLVGPYDTYNVAMFQERAKQNIEEIKLRGNLPIIVGGTGLYINSLFYDYDLKNQDSEKRRLMDSKSVEELQAEIVANGFKMPSNSQNKRHLTGILAREGLNSVDSKPIEGAHIYGIKPEDELLKQRINDRVEVMFDNGLPEEVRSLINKFGPVPDSVDAICYPIVSNYLRGITGLQEAKQLFKSADWKYARRQKSWFKRNKYIKWYNSSEEAYEHILTELNKS